MVLMVANAKLSVYVLSLTVATDTLSVNMLTLAVATAMLSVDINGCNVLCVEINVSKCYTVIML